MNPATFILLALYPLFIQGISIKYIPETRNPPEARKLSGFTLDKFDSKLYMYGGISINNFGDLWEFDLIKNEWREIYPASVLNPGPRSGPFLTRLINQRKILLLGGNTSNGPVNDIWLYDIDYQTWKLVEENGTPPPRGFFRAITEFIHENNHYIAIYGGKSSSGYLTSLFLLDLETFTWVELPSLGDAPIVTMQEMKYYNKSLYILGDFNSVDNSPLYKYEIATGIWTRIQPVGEKLYWSMNYGLCIYNDHLYSILGSWDANSVIKINLTSENYQAERMFVDNTGLGVLGIGYYCDESMIYWFGGYTFDGKSNSLAVLNFDVYPLKFKFLSYDMKVPNGRRGHAMNVYNDKLYIYGGKTHSGS